MTDLEMGVTPELPEIVETGRFTAGQEQVTRVINLTLAGQALPEDLASALGQEEIGRIQGFAQSEPRVVEGREDYPPEDLQERILLVALPEQIAKLNETQVFLAGDFTGWESGAWSFTYLDRNVFALKAEGARGQQCKLYAHHPKMAVGALGQHLAKNGIEKPGIDGAKGNAWFLVGGGTPSGAYQNSTW